VHDFNDDDQAATAAPSEGQPQTPPLQGSSPDFELFTSVYGRPPGIDDLYLQLALDKAGPEAIRRYLDTGNSLEDLKNNYMQLADIQASIKRSEDFRSGHVDPPPIPWPGERDQDTHNTQAQAPPDSPPLTSAREPTTSTVGQDVKTNQPVTLQDRLRTRHISVIGKTGYGKTTLLEHLLVEDLHSNTSAILIDPHGDLSQRIITLARDNERERITLLEQWPDSPFRLNLLECPDPTQTDRTVDDILTMFHRLFDPGTSQLGFRLHRYLGNALRTLIPNKRTLADVQRLFTDHEFRGEMLLNVRNRKVHEFWRMFDQMPPREQIEQLESTINRLDEFLSSEAAHAMVDSTETTIPLDRVLTSNGQLLLVRIPIGELGEAQAKFYGSLFLSLLTDRLFARSQVLEAERHRLHLYLDEYGWFATSTTATLLQQARKYNLGATIAFQTLADLTDEKNKQAALQVGTSIILQLVGKNADELVSEFEVHPREQYQEVVEESYGNKSTLAPTQEPIRHLLTNGHRNPQAPRVAQRFLRRLTNEAETRKKNEEEQRRDMKQISLRVSTGRSSEALAYSDTVQGQALSQPRAYASARTVEKTLQSITTLLVAVMQHGTAFIADRLASELVDVFLPFMYEYGFPSNRPLQEDRMHFDTQEPITLVTNDPVFKERFGLFLKQAIEAPTSDEFRTSSTDVYKQPWSTLIHIRRMLQIENERQNIDSGSFEKTVKRIGAGLNVDTEHIRMAVGKLIPDIMDLITLCQILAVDPILVPTGQEEPDLRPRYITHPPQTHQDARLELAGILANLKEYTAFYQISEPSNPSGQVSLAEPLTPLGLDEEAVQQVRDRSRELYGVPISDHIPSVIPAPSAPRPRIGRRPPRNDQLKDHT
jgi:hypothetical protein